MNEQHQEDSNEDEDGESEDGGNRLDEESEDEELQDKSDTCDVNANENYLQGKYDDDNPQFTFTPKGNIKMVNNIQLYCMSYFSIQVSYGHRFHIITLFLFIICRYW